MHLQKLTYSTNINLWCLNNVKTPKNKSRSHKLQNLQKHHTDAFHKSLQGPVTGSCSDPRYFLHSSNWYNALCQN